MNLPTAATSEGGSATISLEAVYRHVADAHQRLAFTTDLAPDDKVDCRSDLLATMEGLEPFLSPLDGRREGGRARTPTSRQRPGQG